MRQVDGGSDRRHGEHHLHHPTTFCSTVIMPSDLLEVTVISAQGLYPAGRSMHTYASAWMEPEHKLYTRVDRAGRADPTWNDKFVFRVDEAFLLSDTAAINVHLHAARGRLSPLSDHLLGTVRVVLSGLRLAPGPPRFVALQVRRPYSLRPCGILNLGVALLDSLAAFAYKDLNDAKPGKSNSQRWGEAAQELVGGGGEWRGGAGEGEVGDEAGDMESRDDAGTRGGRAITQQEEQEEEEQW